MFDLSENEKRILRELSRSHYVEGMFSDLSIEELSVTLNHLQEYGLIKAMYASALKGNILVSANLSDEGIVYLKDNPTLENPASDNKLKKLQINELEYKKRIRWQNDLIRIWQLISAILALIALIGWFRCLF